MLLCATCHKKYCTVERDPHPRKSGRCGNCGDKTPKGFVCQAYDFRPPPWQTPLPDPIDRDVRVLMQCVRALLQSSSERMLKANVAYLCDRFVTNRNPLSDKLKKTKGAV